MTKTSGFAKIILVSRNAYNRPVFGFSVDAANSKSNAQNEIVRFARFLAYNVGELSNQLNQMIDPV